MEKNRDGSYINNLREEAARLGVEIKTARRRTRESCGPERLQKTAGLRSARRDSSDQTLASRTWPALSRRNKKSKPRPISPISCLWRTTCWHRILPQPHPPRFD